MGAKGVIKKGEYFDSVTLMNVARRLGAVAGVTDSAVVMGTAANKSILKNSGLLLPEFAGAGDTDLLIAVQAGTETALADALRKADAYLKESRRGSSAKGGLRASSLDGALALLPGANLAVVSVAGRYAGGLAMDCLQKGLSVMLFSDNVPLETEVELKRFARDRGLIVMGPDCGTAIIHGVPLAFANAVRRGSVGVVAAAGTGLQEVTTLVSNEGVGISQGIGTGGRDVKTAVGGIAFLQGLDFLAADPQTKVIVLVSKPPDPDVLEKITARAAGIGKPMVAVFLGGDPAALGQGRISAFATLEAAATAAVFLAKGQGIEKSSEYLARRHERIWELAKLDRSRKKASQKYIRGLFSGGTFCAEAQVVLGPIVGAVHSNAPLQGHPKLEDPLRSVGHTVVDLGEDEFTVGRPHPMIDYSLRDKRILAEARDPETSVILLDVVIGYGSHPAPLDELGPVVREAIAVADGAGRHLSVVCSVTGTDADPQNRSLVAKGLEAAGAAVLPSNAAACRLAGEIVRGGEHHV
ncbi:MAG: hypothetical protein A2X36_16980 [Elusimicrobia bacterium GWA2_69_24]|nr:MAG: hypothetical protein A2X36_16980 [Elusimicrobia bacterium GWA2_69_24]HBL16126.1 FdrA family protein [Elusimicrobiota bacterium]